MLMNLRLRRLRGRIEVSVRDVRGDMERDV